jgi:hypothetical protein
LFFASQKIPFFSCVRMHTHTHTHTLWSLPVICMHMPHNIFRYACVCTRAYVCAQTTTYQPYLCASHRITSFLAWGPFGNAAHVHGSVIWHHRLYIRTYIYIYIYIYNTYVHTDTWICDYVYAYVCTCVCVCVWYARVYVCGSFWLRC